MSSARQPAHMVKRKGENGAWGSSYLQNPGKQSGFFKRGRKRAGGKLEENQGGMAADSGRRIASGKTVTSVPGTAGMGRRTGTELTVSSTARWPLMAPPRRAGHREGSDENGFKK